jgi:hypothetical protein
MVDCSGTLEFGRAVRRADNIPPGSTNNRYGEVAAMVDPVSKVRPYGIGRLVMSNHRGEMHVAGETGPTRDG